MFVCGIESPDVYREACVVNSSKIAKCMTPALSGLQHKTKENMRVDRTYVVTLTLIQRTATS
jgi:hypothetical protein